MCESVVRPPAPNCVVKVDGGRDFIIVHHAKVPNFTRRKGIRARSCAEKRMIITASQCLPNVPAPDKAPDYIDRTFLDLVASLDNSHRDISVECVFVDPIADIAVLGCPDAQQLNDKADAFNAMIEEPPALRIGHARSGKGWILSLQGRRIRTDVQLHVNRYGPSLFIGPTEPGMSGSPILNDAGRAIGVVALGSDATNASGVRRNERVGPQPKLIRSLPGWLLND